jgi:hypothetical protein
MIPGFSGGDLELWLSGFTAGIAVTCWLYLALLRLEQKGREG